MDIIRLVKMAAPQQKRRKIAVETLTELKGRYTSIIKNLLTIFKDKKLDVNPLILKLDALDNDKITLFSTDRAFKKVKSVDELFSHIEKYCSIFDYELLAVFVEAVECQEAINVLDGFTKELQSSILSDLDLLCDEQLQDPKDFLPRTHKLVIGYVGKFTMQTKELAQNTICKLFHLKRGSITFKGVQQKGSGGFVYQISVAVKAHLQQFPITAKEISSKTGEVEHLIIDDEEVKFPTTLEAEFTVVITGTTGNGKSAFCNFFMQKNFYKSKRSFVPVSKTSQSGIATIAGKRIELVDTPGFLDPTSMEDHTERVNFAKGLINIKSGFHMLGLILNSTKRIEVPENRLFKNLLSTYEHYLPYLVLIFTRGKTFGDTEDEQKSELEDMIKEIEGELPHFKKVLDKINHRYMILEAVDPMEQLYHASKSKELIKIMNMITEQAKKPVTNDFALAIAENLKKKEVDEHELEEELANRIKEAQDMMKKDKSVKSGNFYTYLKYAIIASAVSGGILAGLIPPTPTGIGITLGIGTALTQTVERCVYQ